MTYREPTPIAPEPPAPKLPRPIPWRLIAAWSVLAVAQVGVIAVPVVNRHEPTQTIPFWTFLAYAILALEAVGLVLWAIFEVFGLNARMRA